MKWFQHYSDSHTNPKIRKIMREYGVEGVGFWWICCELVAKDGEDNYKLSGGKEWMVILQDITRFENKKITEILQFFGKINLISAKNLTKGNLCIPKMSEYASNWKRRIELKNDVGTTEGLRSAYGAPTAKDKIRIDKIRKEKSVSSFIFKNDESAPLNLELFFNGNPMRFKSAEKKWYVIENGQWMQWCGSYADEQKIVVKEK